MNTLFTLESEQSMIFLWGFIYKLHVINIFLYILVYNYLLFYTMYFLVFLRAFKKSSASLTSKSLSVFVLSYEIHIPSLLSFSFPAVTILH